ncbi:MAG: hypothetical protein WHU94_14820, partial [Thermogemmata sp.]
GLLAKIFGAVSREEMRGISLDTTGPYWELSGATDFPSLLEALETLLPPGCVLYFEDGGPSGELARFLREHAVPERAHLAYGTIWPRPLIFHVPATADTIRRLAELMRSRLAVELAVHFHVYRDQTVLLEWYDAFTQPMRLAGLFSEDQVRLFAQRLGMVYEKRAGSGGGPPVAPA